MQAEQNLPNKVLQKQVCQECFGFLSVPPIVINKSGESICGRCIKAGKQPYENYTRSLFDVVAVRFRFKCMNYLNGCKETLKFAEVEPHEAVCAYYQTQECFFCSFSGNLAQILHHSLKVHVDVTYSDECIQFSLSDDNFSKTVLLVLNDTDMVLGILEATDELIKFKVNLLTTCEAADINQYEIKIWRDDDPVNVVIHSDYSLFSKKLWNAFKKSKQQLKQLFGPFAQLNLRILFDQFRIEDGELTLYKNTLALQKKEECFYNLKAAWERKQKKLDEDQSIFQTAMAVIKIMSYNLFKCSVCKKNSFNNIYFCPKMHCYCKTCISSFCQQCNTVTEFKQLSNIENFNIPREWPGCTQQLPLRHFLLHKSGCAQRPYKCPLRDCKDVVYSANQLVEHWHCSVPSLLVNCELLCQKYEHMEYYLFAGSDLYHIIVNFNAQKIEVLVEENNVLGEATVTCAGYSGNVWEDIVFSTFCGRKKIDMNQTKRQQQLHTQSTAIFGMVVPKSWYIETSSECFWPPSTHKVEKILRLIQQCDSPQTDWKVHPAKKLGSYDSFHIAKKKAEKAIETSDISSCNEGLNIKRKRRKNPKFNSDDSGSNSNESDDNSYPTFKKAFSQSLSLGSKKTLKRFRSRSYSPTASVKESSVLAVSEKNSQIPTTSTEGISSKYPRQGEILLPPASPTENLQDFGSGAYLNSGQVQPSTPCQQARANDNIDNEFKKIVLNELSHLHLKINAIAENITTIMSFHAANAQIPLSTVEEVGYLNRMFPIKHIAQLNELENWLAEEKNYKLMVTEFRRIGGQSMPQTVRRILYRALTNTMGNLYSWDGAKKKSPFKHFLLARGVIEAVKAQYMQSKENEIIDIIRVWMVKAKERLKNEFARENDQEGAEAAQ